jgi:predicted lipid carrier protein YhbT
MGDGTVHLHCTDVDGEWLFTRRDGEITVTAEHAKGDVAARGRASDLLLFLWGRVPATELEVFGDAALLERFSAGMRV